MSPPSLACIIGIGRRDASCESKEDQFEYLMNKNDHGKVCFLDPTGMPTAHFKPMVFDRVEYIEKNIVEALTER